MSNLENQQTFSNNKIILFYINGNFDVKLDKTKKKFILPCQNFFLQNHLQIQPLIYESIFCNIF